jgi:hypothetical protein
VSTHGRLNVCEGVVSAIADSSRFEAAVVDDMAAIEIALADANVTIGENDGYREPLVLTLSMSPAAMRQMLAAIAEALGLPAFTEPEWRRIGSVLRAVHGGEQIDELAARIEAVYP